MENLHSNKIIMLKQIVKYSRQTYLILSFFHLILFFVILRSLYIRSLYIPETWYRGSLTRIMPIAGYQLGFIMLFIILILLIATTLIFLKKHKYKIILFRILFIVQSALIIPLVGLIYKWQLYIFKFGYVLIIPIILLSILMILNKFIVKKTPVN